MLASLLDMNCHFEGQERKDSSMGINGPLMWQVVWQVSPLLLLLPLQLLLLPLQLLLLPLLLLLRCLLLH